MRMQLLRLKWKGTALHVHSAARWPNHSTVGRHKVDWARRTLHAAERVALHRISRGVPERRAASEMPAGGRVPGFDPETPVMHQCASAHTDLSGAVGRR
jgi:hypothetical protein